MEHWKKLVEKSNLSEAQLKQIPSDNIGNFQAVLKIYKDNNWDIGFLLKDSGITIDDFKDSSTWLNPRTSETISRNFFSYAGEKLNHTFGYNIGIENANINSLIRTVLKNTPFRTIIKNGYTTARKLENSFDYEVTSPNSKSYGFKVTPKAFKRLALVGHESFVFQGFLNAIYLIKNIKIDNFKTLCRSSNLVDIINFFYKNEGFEINDNEIYFAGKLFAEKKLASKISGLNSFMSEFPGHKVFVILNDHYSSGEKVFSAGEVYNAPFCYFSWDVESKSLIIQKIKDLFLFIKKKSLGDLEELIAKNNERAKELLQLTAVLKEEERNKSLFLANIVHEIKSPLASIVMLIDSMMDHINCAPDFVKEGFLLLGDKSNNLTNFVDNVMSYFNVDNNSVELSLEKIDIAFLLSDVLDNFTHLSNKKDLYINCLIVPDRFMIDGDYYRLVQVFLNIIGNSVKFTTKGSIVISAEFENDFVAISIEDTGIGIEPEIFDKIFNMFELNKKNPGINKNGIGLGLYIAKSIIDLHCGKITVTSNYKVGTTFKVLLPYSAS